MVGGRRGVWYRRAAMPIDPSLPGAELIDQGIADLAAGRETAEALLVAIGATRLRAAGLDVPEPGIEDPEHRLYDLISRTEPRSAHSRYNALIRRLVSLERAAERASQG
jgi:hypothetical protein